MTLQEEAKLYLRLEIVTAVLVNSQFWHVTLYCTVSCCPLFLRVAVPCNWWELQRMTFTLL